MGISKRSRHCLTGIDSNVRDLNITLFISIRISASGASVNHDKLFGTDISRSRILGYDSIWTPQGAQDGLKDNLWGCTQSDAGAGRQRIEEVFLKGKIHLSLILAFFLKNPPGHTIN